jgi:hypothetical protein
MSAPVAAMLANVFFFPTKCRPLIITCLLFYMSLSLAAKNSTMQI